MHWSRGCGSTPRPLVALACGSRSTSKTRRSAAAMDAARFTAVVVFPTPPFWFATATIRAMAGLLVGAQFRRTIDQSPDSLARQITRKRQAPAIPPGLGLRFGVGMDGRTIRRDGTDPIDRRQLGPPYHRGPPIPYRPIGHR